MTREIFLVGSVTDRGERLRPAAAVFDALIRNEVAESMRYVPDGEQAGWLRNALNQILAQGICEPAEPAVFTHRPTSGFTHPWPTYQLKEGYRASDIAVHDLGIVESATRSYAEFKARKDAGHFPAETRFAVTMPGPGTAFFSLRIPADELFPIAIAAHQAEIARICAAIPHEDLAIQIDLAIEVEYEEFRRRPGDYDTTLYDHLDWPMEDQIAMVAAVSDAVPSDVDLGYHLCCYYHVDASVGQDLNVHVDWCNALRAAITHRIDYIHVPTTPAHDESDFAALGRLEMDPATHLELGVVHIELGLEGSRRLIEAAASTRPEFGIATFCGLALPSRPEFLAPHSIDEILQLHRQVAAL